jgi:hypothetical protein
MHRLRAWGVPALLAILGGTAAAADPDSMPTGFDRGAAAFNRWNAGQIERPKPPPVPPQLAAAKAKAQDTAAALRAQEEANFLRRLAACDKLRQLALDTGDDSLEKLADDLQQKAEAVFKARTANLAAGAPGADPDARASAATKREGKR